MSDTRIGQVRIRTNTDDPLAARMRGDAALRALDLEPPGMPARTILCIRSMADPLPGGLDLRSSHAPRATEWERAARNAIRDALHRAVRVVDGAVPADADAVLFADRAELLACAARDVARGGDGWWWRDTIRGGLASAHVVREWLRAPEYVPAALELLVRSGDFVAFVRRMEASQAVELTVNVLRVHALEALARRIVESVSAATPAVRRTAVVAVPALLRKLVPEVVASNMTLEQSVFAVVTLAVRRSPVTVRTESFVRQVSEWIDVPGSPSKRVDTSTVVTNNPPKDLPTLNSIHEEHSIPATQPTNEEEQRRAGFSPPPPSARASSAAHERDGLKPVLRSTTRLRRKAATAASPAPVAAPVESIHSDYAGLFFLLNLAVALGYYDPYGREPQLDLDIWDFLALTGRALLERRRPAGRSAGRWPAAGEPPADRPASGRRSHAIDDDPIWPLLMQLAGGKRVRARRRAFQLWPRAFSAGSRGRTRLAAAKAAATSTPWSGRLRGRGFLALLRSPGKARGHNWRARLRAQLPPEVLTRVREALALVVDHEDPAAFVLQRPGRIDLSPAHVDVTFCLAAHPIEIRIAGLDRDPGWIPAAGRHVAFHFD